MKVISLRQPWAWLVVSGPKSVENRSWATKHRGPILIHAARNRDADFAGAVAYALARGVVVPVDELRYGGIVGRACVVDCVSASKSPWFMGPIAWKLAERAPLPFVPMSGKLQVFDAPADVLTALGIEEDEPAQYCLSPNI